ncbi:MAG: GNAT family N-acetyltransferase [Ornithinibacter sp.]
MTAPARMRPATVHDLPGVYRVCLQTGLSGGDASDAHTDPDLLGHVYAGPYVLFPDAVALVVVDAHGVSGYCVGVPDTLAFEQWCAREWWPPLRAQHPLDPRSVGATPSDSDAGLIRRFHHPVGTEPALAASYPAHLHIDLLPRLQGLGWGRRLMCRMLEQLAVAGAGGVHLGVAEANTGAHVFYERIDFAVVDRDDRSRTYARSLVT